MVCFLYLCNPPFISAADTCCVGHGGDYSCNVSTSQLYCADGTVSTECSCHASPTATPVPTAIPPTATPIPAPSSPSCPADASFSESSNACACNSGYVVSSNACVTYAQYCQVQYGSNSVYDSSGNSCACSSGYTWNTAGSACVTMDALCNEKIGNNSYYNSSDNSCYCYGGYSIQNNQCQVMPTPVPPDTPAPTMGIPIGPVKPVALPTLAAVIVPTHEPMPTKAPVKKPVKFDLNKKVPGLNGFIAVKKKQGGFFDNILSSIWIVIKLAFNF